MVEATQTPTEEQVGPEDDPNAPLIPPTPAAEAIPAAEATTEATPAEATETPAATEQPPTEETPNYEVLVVQLGEQTKTIEKLTARLNTQEGMVRRSRERDIAEARRDQIVELFADHLDKTNPDLGLRAAIEEVRNRSDNEVRQDQQAGIVTQMAA